MVNRCINFKNGHVGRPTFVFYDYAVSGNYAKFYLDSLNVCGDITVLGNRYK